MANYNPYAAPTPSADQGLGAQVVQGEPQPWDVGDAIRSGWDLYKANWAALTFGCFVTTLVASLPGQLAPTLVQSGALEQGTGPYFAVHIPATVVGWMVGEFFAAGFTRAALRASRIGSCTFGDFFAGGSRFLAYLGMSFLRSLAIGLGLVLFVVPGIIVALGFWNAQFYVVDQNLGPVTSLKASWDSSEGHKVNLFVFFLAEFGITLLGMMACCVGMFVAIPLMLVARTIIYMKMSGTAPPLVAPPGAYAYAQQPPMSPTAGGGGGYGGGPPGYGGGPPGYGGGPPGY